jgi:pimeloyl-ACP methyl ester carboxylesterase
MTFLDPHELVRPDATIRYWTGGDATGPTVVLLHGATLDHRAWAPQVDVLQDRFRLVVPDLRAHGESTGSFDFEAAVQDVFALLDALPAGRVVLVGLSLGGNLAQEVVHHKPDRVSAIVVADATCNTGARHPLATSITVVGLGTHAMLPGNHFAQYAAQMIALDPQVQREPPEPGDRAHPDVAADRRAATRAGLPAAGARTAGPRPTRSPRRHRPGHPSLGAARAAGRVRRDSRRRARQQPRQPRGVHRGAAGVPRPGASTR